MNNCNPNHDCDSQTASTTNMPVRTSIPCFDVPTLLAKTIAIQNLRAPHEAVARIERYKKLLHYQRLTNSLTQYILRDARSKIESAAAWGHGWTNLFQYYPTNHPNGDVSEKYWAGLDHSGHPIQSIPGQGGAPIILLMQGPKVGNARSQASWLVEGFHPVMSQLQMAISRMCQRGEIKLHHRWVGKNGYVIETVWDHAMYQRKIDGVVRKSFMQQKRRAEARCDTTTHDDHDDHDDAEEKTWGPKRARYGRTPLTCN